MLFRVHIAVVRAIPSAWWRNIPECERDSCDAVACTFGVNADTMDEAVRIAVTAAANAVNRNGDFIGGVPVEVNCRCVDREQFEGYDKYFHNPIDQRGIFHVSGTSGYSIQKALTADASAKLGRFRSHIKEFGLPKPSFVHPQLPKEPPRTVRLLCSECLHWVEVSNEGMMYSFMEGLDCFSLEEDEPTRQDSLAGHFMRAHLDACRAKIVGVLEDDPRWATLEEEKRESQAP